MWRFIIWYVIMTICLLGSIHFLFEGDGLFIIGMIISYFSAYMANKNFKKWEK